MPRMTPFHRWSAAGADAVNDPFTSSDVMNESFMTSGGRSAIPCFPRTTHVE